MQVFLLLAMVFAVVIAVFAVQNTATASIVFLAWETQGVSLSVLVLVSAAVGAFLTFFLGIWRVVRMSMTIRNDRKKLEEQASTIEGLRESNNHLEESLRGLRSDYDALKMKVTPTAAASAGTAEKPTITFATTNANEDTKLVVDDGASEPQP